MRMTGQGGGVAAGNFLLGALLFLALLFGVARKRKRARQAAPGAG